MFGLKRVLVLACVIAALLAFQAGATSVLQMNLDQLCDDADQIFRGTVLDVTETTVSGGGGDIPALVYKLQVDETFKGSFTTVKGVQIAEIKVVGSLKQYANNKSVIPGFPTLQVGHDYLLMVAPAGPIGLTATMGLGQGCFDIYGKSSSEMAVNEFDNAGLFDGVSAPGMPSSGPVSYSALATLIHDTLGGE